jgi:copper oxidase (laccase) domain-containing protein
VRRGRNLDLKAIARDHLERAGVSVVHDVGLCTICSDETLFFSHRRDRGVTGRQAGIAWLS